MHLRHKWRYSHVFNFTEIRTSEAQQPPLFPDAILKIYKRCLICSKEKLITEVILSLYEMQMVSSHLKDKEENMRKKGVKYEVINSNTNL